MKQLFPLKSEKVVSSKYFIESNNKTKRMTESLDISKMENIN